MLNVARWKIKEFHLNCDNTFLVHIGKENMKELHVDGFLELILFRINWRLWDLFPKDD